MPSTQLLIERIVKLQQALARRKEKIEILEEHRRHLIRDLRKKSQIIQHYVLTEDIDAMSTAERDRNKACLFHFISYFYCKLSFY